MAAEPSSTSASAWVRSTVGPERHPWAHPARKRPVHEGPSRPTPHLLRRSSRTAAGDLGRTVRTELLADIRHRHLSAPVFVHVAHWPGELPRRRPQSWPPPNARAGQADHLAPGCPHRHRSHGPAPSRGRQQRRRHDHHLRSHQPHGQPRCNPRHRRGIARITITQNYLHTLPGADAKNPEALNRTRGQHGSAGSGEHFDTDTPTHAHGNNSQNPSRRST
jgi:hypothetical protein